MELLLPFHAAQNNCSDAIQAQSHPPAIVAASPLTGSRYCCNTPARAGSEYTSSDEIANDQVFGNCKTQLRWSPDSKAMFLNVRQLIETQRGLELKVCVLTFLCFTHLFSAVVDGWEHCCTWCQ